VVQAIVTGHRGRVSFESFPAGTDRRTVYRKLAETEPDPDAEG